jgi:hypothetical protein
MLDQHLPELGTAQLARLPGFNLAQRTAGAFLGGRPGLTGIVKTHSVCLSYLYYDTKGASWDRLVPSVLEHVKEPPYTRSCVANSTLPSVAGRKQNGIKN